MKTFLTIILFSFSIAIFASCEQVTVDCWCEDSDKDGIFEAYVLYSNHSGMFEREVTLNRTFYVKRACQNHLDHSGSVDTCTIRGGVRGG